jgi:hypothetical protein
MEGARASRSASTTRTAITKTRNESDGLDPSHFLPCIGMAKLEVKGLLLNHWFEI